MDYTSQLFSLLFCYRSYDEPVSADQLRDEYVSYVIDTTSEGFARDVALSLPIDFDLISSMVVAA